jgi:starvation-inducible DNA-binding protein
MNELTTAIKILLANTTVMYYKAHQFHWNIEGIEFTQYHDFLGDLYTDVYNSVDPIAELLRKLDEYTPVSIDELYKYKTIEEESTRVVLLSDILASLLKANEEVLASLNKVFALATAANKQGMADFIAGRIDAHDKHSWFLRASAKKIG